MSGANTNDFTTPYYDTNKESQLCTIDRMFAHERELSKLTTVTEKLAEQGLEICTSLKSLSTTMVKLQTVLENQQTQEEKIEKVSVDISEIHSKMIEAAIRRENEKEERTELNKRLDNLDDRTNNLGWINKSVGMIQDKIGVILLILIIGVAISHWSYAEKFLNFLK